MSDREPTEADARNLVEKLKNFAGTLEPAEEAILQSSLGHNLLQESGEEPEVTGHLLSGGTVTTLPIIGWGKTGYGYVLPVQPPSSGIRYDV